MSSACRSFLMLCLLTALLVGCGQEPVSPSNGGPAFSPAANGNKLVFIIDESDHATCPGSGAVLSIHEEGWVQVRTFDQPANKNLELDVFHSVITFTNAAGQTFAFRDVGPDHFYLDQNGDLIVTITGRSTGTGVIGHLVLNLTTFEVTLIAGKNFGSVVALACQALT